MIRPRLHADRRTHGFGDPVDIIIVDGASDFPSMILHFDHLQRDRPALVTQVTVIVMDEAVVRFV